jgi:protease-4
MDLTRQEKPVVASMGDLAASGGYYISCYADTIVAHPNTITGSIGAFGLFMTGEELMHDKLGINIETVSTNKYGDLGTFDRALTDSEKAILIASVDKIYGTFKERVATGRNMSIEMVDSLGQGRVWSGKDALDRGLVDVLGGLDDAIEIAKNMAGLDDDYSVVEYPKLEDPIARLIKELGGDIETRMIKNKLGEFSRYVDLLEKTKSMQGFQTRLEYDLVID